MKIVKKSSSVTHAHCVIGSANKWLLDLDQPGFLRLRDVLQIIPVSRSSWYAGAGEIYPSPVSLGGGRAVGYRKSDIKALVESLSKGANHA